MSKDNSDSKLNQTEDIDKTVFIHRLLNFFPAKENAQKKTSNGTIGHGLSELHLVLAELLEKQKLSLPKVTIDSVSKLLETSFPKQFETFSKDLIHALSLIDRLFDYILDEKHLPKELKQLIGGLRLIFLKIALTDQKLFIDSTHPFRLLINEMTKLALLWSPNDPKTFAIHAQLNNIVESVIHAEPTQNINLLLSRAAKNLNLFSTGFIKKVEIFEKRIREAEEGKAKVLEAKSLAWSVIEELTQKKNIPGFVLNFLKQSWQHVIFLENIKSIEAEKGQAKLIAKRLLVSLQPIKSEENLQKHSELLVPLIKQIEPELTKTSLTQTEATTFIQNLCDYHKNLISVAKSSIDKENASDLIIRLKPAVNFDTQVIETTPDESLLKPISEMELDEWVDFVFDGIPSLNHLSSPKDNEESLLAAHDKGINKLDLSQILKLGDWFEITLDKVKSRCKLVSYISQSDKFIFVSGSGIKVAEFDTDSIQKALSNKELVSVDDTPLFEKAFELVKSEAEHEHQREIKKKQLKEKFETEQKRLKALEIARIEKLKQDEILRITKEKERISQLEAELIKNENEKIIQQIDQLSIGSWVEIKINHAFEKCRLAAKITSTGKYIFVNRSGVKVKELYEQDLNQLYDTGQIKVKQKIDVFDSALASVISKMREQK